MNDLVATASQAVVEVSGKNYKVISPITGNEVILERNIDFGKIPGTKQPSLFKSGAEKICMAYGLMQRPEIVSKIEQPGKEAYFFYNVRMNLVKGFTTPNGEYQEVVFASSYGSANTNERRNGNNSPDNSANATLKMAIKRSLVSAAIAISGLSSMFSMDLEDENTPKNAAKVVQSTPDSTLTKEQIERMLGLMGQYGIGADEMPGILEKYGYKSSKEIKQKDFKAILADIKNIDSRKD